MSDTSTLAQQFGGAIPYFVLGVFCLSVSACQDTNGFANARAQKAISNDTLNLMAQKGTDAHQPVLIRTYKKESEFEIWKMRSDGTYALLKSYPMCRWSGQLGPKMREGDRQVPEGFYAITPGQMNPNSSYYLSFNVGFPNAYDKAHGYSGGSIMVHGACSSAGCFSMTDAQIGEIYAILREGFAGGQRSIQMQSYPFHMTAENLAKYRLDPNMPFWRELKDGSDNFEVAKQEPIVNVCDGHYYFNGAGKCSSYREEPTTKAMVAEKQQQDDAQIAQLVSGGVAPVRAVYSDGGQNPYFSGQISEVSRPEALAQGGPSEVPLEDRQQAGQSPVVRVAAAKTVKTGAKMQMAAKPQTIVAKQTQDAGKPDDSAPKPASSVTAMLPDRAHAANKTAFSGLAGLRSSEGRGQGNPTP